MLNIQYSDKRRSNLIHFKSKALLEYTLWSIALWCVGKPFQNTANWVLEHLIGNQQQETLKQCFFFLLTFSDCALPKMTMLIFLQATYLLLLTCEFLVRGGSSQGLTGKGLFHFIIDSHIFLSLFYVTNLIFFQQTVGVATCLVF